MKKIVVLGCSGLIGHKLFQRLSERFSEVYGTLHTTKKRFEPLGIFENDKVIEHVDVLDFDRLTSLLDELGANIVLNCVGITKRRSEIQDPLKAIEINALFPHKLAHWAKKKGARVIHFSTDCVFDGSDGYYDEQSPQTACDCYGKTKALGEIRNEHTLTIRSSFIGRELEVKSELLEWFLTGNHNEIDGYSQAMYSGISTIQMARIVGDIIELYPDLNQLYNLSIQKPISKYDLLNLANDCFSRGLKIRKNVSFNSNMVLNSSLLRTKIPLNLPDWPSMMKELADDSKIYGETIGNF